MYSETYKAQLTSWAALWVANAKNYPHVPHKKQQPLCPRIVSHTEFDAHDEDVETLPLAASVAA